METKLFKKTGTKNSDIAQLLKGNIMVHTVAKDFAILVQYNKDNKIFIAGIHDAIARPVPKKDAFIVQTLVYKGQHYTEMPIEGLSLSESIIDVLKDIKEYKDKHGLR